MTSAGQPRAVRMLAVLGHELRNPLAASVAGVSAVAELTDPSDPRRVFLDRALHDLGRVSGLLDRYLEFGRSGAVRGVRIDVAQLLRRVAAHPAPRVLSLREETPPGQEQETTARAPSGSTRGPQGFGPRGRAELRVAVDESVAGGGSSPLLVDGDGVLLERALENLIDNARQAGAQTVRLAARREAERVIVEVSDDGRGIPEAMRERLFEPFVSGGTGSGLGLALVAEVLESHGGEIAALPSDRGARFRIALPARPTRTLALARSDA